MKFLGSQNPEGSPRLYRFAEPQPGAVAIHHADGTVTRYFPAEDSDEAGGASLAQAQTDFRSGERMRIGPGTFPTAQWDLNPHDNITVEGAGERLTTLKLNDIGPGIIYNTAAIVAGGRDGITLRDFCIDANLQGQSSTDFSLGAVQLTGDNLRYERMRAINWGQIGTGGECFVFYIAAYEQATRPNYGGRIVDCIVEQAAPIRHGAYVSTLFGICGGSNEAEVETAFWFHDAKITGCVARNITTGNGIGQPRYLNMGGVGVYLGEFAGNVMHGCTGLGLGGHYSDSWAMDTVSIHDNLFPEANITIVPYRANRIDISRNVCKGIAVGKGAGYPRPGSIRISQNRCEVIALNRCDGARVDDNQTGAINAENSSAVFRDNYDEAGNPVEAAA